MSVEFHINRKVVTKVEVNLAALNLGDVTGFKTIVSVWRLDESPRLHMLGILPVLVLWSLILLLSAFDWKMEDTVT